MAEFAFENYPSHKLSAAHAASCGDEKAEFRNCQGTASSDVSKVQANIDMIQNDANPAQCVDHLRGR